MAVTTDLEKQFRYLLEIDEPGVTPLAVPQAGEGLLQLARRLIHGIDRSDRANGGGGVEYNPRGSSETDTELRLLLDLNLDPMGDPIGRMEDIHARLSDLAAKARTQVIATQDADPRSVAARRVVTSIPSRA